MKYISIILILIIVALFVFNKDTIISKYSGNNLAYVAGSASYSSGSTTGGSASGQPTGSGSVSVTPGSASGGGTNTNIGSGSGTNTNTSGLYTLKVNKVSLPEGDVLLQQNSKLYISINGSKPSIIDKSFVGKFKPGTGIKLTVTGSSTIMAFDKWSGSECNDVKIAVCSFVMNNDKVVNSHIAKLQTLTLKSIGQAAEIGLNARGTGNGTVQVNNYPVNTTVKGQTLVYRFKYGTEVTLKAIPFTGYKFSTFISPTALPTEKGYATSSPMLKLKMFKDYYLAAGFSL